MSRVAGGSRARPDTRREELLEATRLVIQRTGLASATVGEITREAGASLGLLNYHFPSKDDVVAEAFAEMITEELAELQEISRLHERPAERLVAFLDQFDWAGEAGWRLWIDGWGQSVHVDALRGTLARFARGWRAVLVQVIEDGVEQGTWQCADPVDTAGRLVAALDGIGLHVTLHIDHVDPAMAEQWARRLVEFELGVTLPARPRPATPRHSGRIRESRVAVRVGDLDAAGHVLAATHLAYLDEGRHAWLAEQFGPVGVPDTTLAQLTLDVHRSLSRSDEAVLVRCGLDRVGRTTIRTRETITTVAGAPILTAEVTIVARDANTGRPRALSTEEREAVAR